MCMCASEFSCRSFEQRQTQTSDSKISGRYWAALGFAGRVRGDHHIFSKSGVSEILNLQPHGSLAKPYQVKQVRSVIIRYKLAKQDE